MKPLALLLHVTLPLVLVGPTVSHAAGTATTPNEPPVAIVCALAGTAEIVTDNTPAPLPLFARLATGATLRLGADAEVVVGMRDGRRFALTGPSEIVIAKEGPSPRGGSASASRELTAVAPLDRVLASVAPGSGGDGFGSEHAAVRIRSGGDDAELLDPQPNEETVLTNSATLRFLHIEGLDRYAVEVEDLFGRQVFTAELSGGTGDSDRLAVSLPAGVLAPGARYLWRVRTVSADVPAFRAEAAFRTLDAASTQLRDEHAAAISGDDQTAVLLLAELDRTLGLRGETCAGLARARQLTAKGGGTTSIDELARSLGCE